MVVLLAMLTIAPLLPIKGVPRTFIVVSGSMEPAIKTGSVVFTKTVKPENLTIGDIIVYTSPKNPKDVIIHRIIKVKSYDPLMFETKGDNNSGADPWDVSITQVKGSLLFVIPYLGYLGSYVRKPLGFILIIGIPAILYIISNILAIKKAINEEVENKVDAKMEKHTGTITKLFVMFISLSLITFPGVKAFFADSVQINGLKISTLSSYDDIDVKNCKEFKKHEDKNKKDKHEKTEQIFIGKDNKFKNDWFKQKYGKKNFQKEQDEFNEFVKCKKLEHKKQKNVGNDAEHSNDTVDRNGNHKPVSIDSETVTESSTTTH